MQNYTSEDIKNMLQYIHELTNLENCTEPILSVDNGKDEEDMASRYREKVLIGKDENGKPIYGWACGDTKEELHKSIAKLLNVSNDSHDKTDTIKAPLWEDAAMKWFETFHRYNVRQKTEEKDRQIMHKHVIPAFKGIRINKITTSMVQDYLLTKQNYSKSYMRDIMNLMRGIFSSAVDDDIMTRNPMDSGRITNPSRKEEGVRGVLSPEDQADIIANIDKVSDPVGRRLLVMLMFTPLRPSEIYGLKWEDFDMENRMIYIQRALVFSKSHPILGDTKTKGSKRLFPISDELLAYLGEIGKEGFIISSNVKGHEGDHLTSEIVLRRMWEKIGKEIDLHGMTPYMGRHTYATNMSRAGIPISTAMAMMGHADERMLLRRYIHTNDADLVNASNQMQDFMKKLKEGDKCKAG